MVGNAGTYGGGIGNVGTLTVISSVIKGNTVRYTGGGIANPNGGVATILSSTIAGNTAEGFEGGGIATGFFGGGTMMVNSCTITGNSAEKGGGISNWDQLTVADSTIASNSAYGRGSGGLYNSGTLTIADSTVASNSASNYGGIRNEGTLTAINDTIADNTASAGGGGLDTSGTATLSNTIIALNTNGTGSSAPADDIAGAVALASAYNLIGTGGSGGLTNGVNGNQVGVVNPGLGTLANNGGPTETIALLTTSPAIDAGSNALAVDPTTGLPLTTDQRGAGFPRIVNGTVDIGAFEFQGAIVAGYSAGWGTQTAVLKTAADGLRLLPAGRNTDMPWLGIDQVPITLSQAETLAAGDVTVSSAIGATTGR